MKLSFVFLIFVLLALASAETKTCQKGFVLKSVDVHQKFSSGKWAKTTKQRCIPESKIKCPEGTKLLKKIRRVKSEGKWKVRAVEKCVKACPEGTTLKRFQVGKAQHSAGVLALSPLKHGLRCVPINKKVCPEGQHYRVLVVKKLVGKEWKKTSIEQCSPCKPSFNYKKVNIHYKTSDGKWNNKKAYRCVRIPTKLPICSAQQEVVTVIKRKLGTNGKWNVRMVVKCMNKCKSGFRAKHITVLSKAPGSSTWRRKRARRCIPITPALKCKPGFKAIRRLIRSIQPNGKVRVKYIQKCQAACHPRFVFEKIQVKTSKGISHATRCVPKKRYNCIAPATTQRHLKRRKIADGKFKVRYVERCVCPFGFKIKRSGNTFTCKRQSTSVVTKNGYVHCPGGYKVKYSIKAVSKYINGKYSAHPQGTFSCVKNNEACKAGFVKKLVVVRSHGNAHKTTLCVPAFKPCPTHHKRQLKYKTVMKSVNGKVTPALKYTHKCVAHCKPGFKAQKVKVQVNGKISVSSRCVPKVTLKCVAPAKLIRKMKRTKLVTGKFHVSYSETCQCPTKMDAVRKGNKVRCEKRKIIPTPFKCPSGQKVRYAISAVLKTIKGKQVARPVGKLTCVKDGDCKTGFVKKSVSIHTKGSIQVAVFCVPSLNPCPPSYRHKFSYRAFVKTVNGKPVAVLRPSHKCTPKPCKKGFRLERVGVKTSQKVSITKRCVPIPTVRCKSPAKRVRKLVRKQLPNGKFRTHYTERCKCPSGHKAVASGKVVYCKTCKPGFKFQKVKIVTKQGVSFEKRCVPSRKIRCIGGTSHRRIIRKKQSNGTFKVHYSESCVCAKEAKRIQNGNVIRCLFAPTKTGRDVKCSADKKLKLVVVAATKLVKGKLVAFPKATMRCVNKKSCKTGFVHKRVVLRSHGKVQIARLCVPKLKACTHGHKHKLEITSHIKQGKPQLKSTHTCVSICKVGKVYQKVLVRSNKRNYISFRCVASASLICKNGKHVRKVHRKKLSNGKIRVKYSESCKCPKGLSASRKGDVVVCAKRKLSYVEKLKHKMRKQIKKAKLLAGQMKALKCSKKTKQVLHKIKAQLKLKEKLIKKLENK
jgi:hypothetical protein